MSSTEDDDISSAMKTLEAAIRGNDSTTEMRPRTESVMNLRKDDQGKKWYVKHITLEILIILFFLPFFFSGPLLFSARKSVPFSLERDAQ